MHKAILESAKDEFKTICHLSVSGFVFIIAYALYAHHLFPRTLPDVQMQNSSGFAWPPEPNLLIFPG